MTAADGRLRRLQARVYGRAPDPAAAVELEAMLAAEPAVAPLRPRGPVRARRPRIRRRFRIAGTIVLTAAALGAGAWGVGAVSARSVSAIGPVSTPVATSSYSADAQWSTSTFVLDATTGRVVDPSASHCPGTDARSTSLERSACRAERRSTH